MTELLQEIEQTLADLLRAGLDTGGSAAADRLRRQAGQCADTGLHTGAALLTNLADSLAARAHTIRKDDLPLADQLCRAVRYIRLCQYRRQEENILLRWQPENPTPPHTREGEDAI